MIVDKPISEINTAELLIGMSMVWKLLADELRTINPNSAKSLTANLESMVTLLRGGTYQGVSGVVAALELFGIGLSADPVSAVETMLKRYEISLPGKGH